MSGTLAQDEWIKRVLGVSRAVPTPSATNKQVRFSPVPTTIPPPGRGGVMLGQHRARSNAVITPPPPPQQPHDFVGGDGKKITIAKSTNGGVLFTAPPPPVGEITFSGGGGKGVALPGAIKALEDSGVLKDAKKIAGASVGSMTAALVAAGITAEDFKDIGNADTTTAQITEGTGGTKKGLLLAAMKNKLTTGSGNPFTGQGLENIVRDVLDETLRKRMLEYQEKCSKDGKPVDDTVFAVSKSLAGNKAGPTFLNLRQLSKVIPAIKEVVITGTYTEEFETVTDKKGDVVKGKDGKEKTKKLKDGNDEGQLYVFDADSEPDLEVAVAVHASASFPAVFKPVDIKLSSGLTVRFIDGGVMNNTPTSSSIGNERKLDPMPESRGMTFVFEDKDGTSTGLLAGKVSPSQGFGAKAADWFTGSNNSAGEYAKNRDMADRPEEIVVVPLKLTLPPKKKGGKPQEFDMRDGTLEFNLPMDAKVGFQEETEKATKAQITREQQPKTREFASDSQMFVSISMTDLKTLKDNNYAGADAAVVFRERVAEMIDKLLEAIRQETAKKGGKVANVLNDKNAKMALDELDNLAGDNVDFQGYVGREMNRGSLDSLLDAMRKGGAKGGPKGGAMKATFAVSDALKAHTYADNILKQLVYPKMKVETKGGSAIEILLKVDDELRGAKTPAEVNEALTMAINHFKNKSDKSLPHRGHKQFAQQLERRMMPIAA